MPEYTTPIHDEMTSFEELVQLNDSARVATVLDSLLPVEIARKFFKLSKDNQIRLLEMLGPERSAGMISKISGLGSATIVEQLPSTRSSQIVKEMTRDQQARLLRKIGEENAGAILEEIRPRTAKKIRKLLSYPEGTAGALLVTDFLAYDSHLRVADVLDDLRQHGDQYSDYDIQYAYVVSG